MKKALVAGLVLLAVAAAAIIRPSGTETKSNARDPTIRAAPAEEQEPIVIQARPGKQGPILLPHFYLEKEEEATAPTT